MPRLNLTAAQIRQLQAKIDGQQTPAPTGSREDDLNRTERKFMEEVLLPDPNVVDIWPHGIRLVLAHNTRYEPDFLVMLRTGELVIYEVKAEWSNGQRGKDDSRAKAKIAASLFPFQIVIASLQPKNKGGGWYYERFRPTRRHFHNTPPAGTSAAEADNTGR